MKKPPPIIRRLRICARLRKPIQQSVNLTVEHDAPGVCSGFRVGHMGKSVPVFAVARVGKPVPHAGGAGVVSGKRRRQVGKLRQKQRQVGAAIVRCV